MLSNCSRLHLRLPPDIFYSSRRRHHASSFGATLPVVKLSLACSSGTSKLTPLLCIVCVACVMIINRDVVALLILVPIYTAVRRSSCREDRGDGCWTCGIASIAGCELQVKPNRLSSYNDAGSWPEQVGVIISMATQKRSSPSLVVTQPSSCRYESSENAGVSDDICTYV